MGGTGSFRRAACQPPTPELTIVIELDATPGGGCVAFKVRPMREYEH